jgi:hypothetical protein
MVKVAAVALTQTTKAAMVAVYTKALEVVAVEIQVVLRQQQEAQTRVVEVVVTLELGPAAVQALYF